MARWIAWATVSAVGASDGCSPEANSARHRASLTFSLVMASCVVVGSSHHPYSAGEGSWAFGSLTDREARVLACLGEGPSNAQIAARPDLSEARVKGYVSRMLDKLGCANRAQAGLLAHDAPGIVSSQPG
jgi:DNA-binding NarL/FixJ family response regulator